MKEYDISKEEWREYHSTATGCTYHINKPVKLFIREGGTGHRVLDAAGIAHWVPVNPYTIIRWYSPIEPVSF